MRLHKVMILCSFAFCIYLSIIFTIGTIPFSDFKLYYETALEILQGNRISDYYKYVSSPGYPYFLAFFFYIFHNHSIVLPQILNALMLTVLIGIYLKTPLVRFRMGIVMGYLMILFNVNYLGMVSVLCAEIPYVFFLLIGMILFWNGIKKMFHSWHEIRGRTISLFIISGLFLAISQSVRPVTFIYLLIFSAIMSLGLNYFMVEEIVRGWKTSFLFCMRSLGLTWVSFFAGTILLYWITGYGLTYAPLQKGLANLYIGSNTESVGRYNQADAELLNELGQKYRWDAEKTNTVLRPIVSDRVKKNWLRNVWILPAKLSQLLNFREIPYFSTYQSKVVYANPMYSLAIYLSWVNVLALFVSIQGWLICLRRRNFLREEFFVFCIAGAVFCYLVLHGYFLEVQGRYSNHLFMLLFWYFPVSLKILWNEFLQDAVSKDGKLKWIGFIMIELGVLIGLISLIADSLGIGGYPGFGWKQAVGSVLGTLIAIAGLMLNQRYRKVCHSA